MKKIIGLLLFFFVIFSCSRSPRVIELTLGKYPDTTACVRSSITLFTKNGSPCDTLFPEVSNTPSDWKNTKTYYAQVDFFQLVYQGMKSGKISIETGMRYFEQAGKDTVGYSDECMRAYIPLAVGIAENGDTCFIVDSNGNGDMLDDTRHILSAGTETVEAAFERCIGGKSVLDTTWIVPRALPGTSFISVLHKDKASTLFEVGGEKYRCNLYSSAGIYENRFAKVEFIGKDTLSGYRNGDYCRITETWFRIDSIRPDGRYLKLVEVFDIRNAEALQEGFKPFSFKAETISGKTINFPADYKGRYVLLDLWSLECGVCLSELKNWLPGAYDRYRDVGFEILAVADNTKEALSEAMKKHPIPWPVVADKDHRRNIQSLYKVDAWPALYLIGPDGRIVAEGNTLQGVGLRNKLQEIYPEVPTFTSYASEDFEKLLQTRREIQLVDVRTPGEYAQGHIGKAINIDVRSGDFLQQAEKKLNKKDPVGVYCKGGVRSRVAAHRLIDCGFEVYNLEKGYDDWTEYCKNKTE